MEILKRFAPSVIQTMKNDVIEADGNEVFWTGKIDENGIVTEVKAGARGNENSVVINKTDSRNADVIIHNHPGGNLAPSDADQSVAYNASDSSLGFYIVDNEISGVYVVVEPVKKRKISLLGKGEASFFLSAEGPFAKNSADYEERPSQISLTDEISRAFNENKIGVFEAGTGVGKSFAYLIPSILWATSNRERVVISTGTINLQQQLFEKDIPGAQKILGKKIKAVLLKGRQNYVCLRRLSEAENERGLFNDDTEIFDRIKSWTENSPTGTKSDLSFVPPENVWTRINSESDGCMGGRCSFREKCFVMKVRKEASEANILVVNHHLLFADIESRLSGAGYEDTAVLPPYRRIVFDEAHGIEDSATSFFSEIITKFKILKQLNLMYRNFRGTSGGFLVQASAVSSFENLDEKIQPAISAVKENFVLLEQCALFLLDEDFTVRLHSANGGKFGEMLNFMAKLKSALTVFIGLVREVLEKIDEKDADIPAVWETKTVLSRLEGFASLCENFCRWDEKDDTVFWLQKVKIPPKIPGEDFTVFVQFIQTPLDIAPLMNSGVFDPMDTVICTSATLRTDRNFSFWTRRVGISLCPGEKVAEGAFDSPFPYRKNVLFAVPSDAPFPDSRYFQNYVEETLPKLILASKGRTLVLFTSFDSLKFSYNASRRILGENGISLFRQGDDDRFRLLEKFRDDNSSVLFATDSFWEGVDVPGSSLSQVVIVKLPFAVPTDPVFSARSEILEKKGGNSFMQLSVPQAVIKFRQGFGRLVRRSDDRGCIIVLDRRIIEKKYGALFTRSIPETPRIYSPLEEILSKIENFLR
jgi:ATP-dependent DNA helicase DinG